MAEAKPIVKPKRAEGEDPATVAAFRELKAKHLTERGTGDTDLEFPEWLKQEAPDKYSLWLRATGKGK